MLLVHFVGVHGRPNSKQRQFVLRLHTKRLLSEIRTNLRDPAAQPSMVAQIDVSGARRLWWRPFSTGASDKPDGICRHFAFTRLTPKLSFSAGVGGCIEYDGSHFGSWLSAEVCYSLFAEFVRPKTDEDRRIWENFKNSWIFLRRRKIDFALKLFLFFKKWQNLYKVSQKSDLWPDVSMFFELFHPLWSHRFFLCNFHVGKTQGFAKANQKWTFIRFLMWFDDKKY